MADLAGPEAPETPDTPLSPEAQKPHTDLTADGTISIAELQSAEAEMAQTLGPEKARETLIAALGQNPQKIEFEAIDYLQGHIGSMEGQVKSYQHVLLGHLAGAKLLDANFDGKLDQNDLIFTEDASGKVNVKKIGQSLRDRVLIGSAMVNSAHAMAKAKHRFGDLEVNPVCWDIDEEDPTTMYLNPDFPPSVALMDIFNNPDLYQFECATALVILRYRAMLDLIGEEDFNRIASDLRIGVWDQEDHAAKVWEVTGRSAGGEDVPMAQGDKSRVTPGDYTYFKNWDVSPEAFRGGWQGENVIYLGDGMYYGHPFRVISGEKIVAYLNKHRNPGSARSASLLDLHARVHSDVLDYDRNPNK